MINNGFRHSIDPRLPLVAICLLLQLSPTLAAQAVASGTMMGRITEGSDIPVPNATLTLTLTSTQEARRSTTRADGCYKFEGLASGIYHLQIEAAGFGVVQIASLSIESSVETVLDEKLAPSRQASGRGGSDSNQQLPNAPSSSNKEPTLSDLGLTPEQTQGNPQEQALLDKRTHMLKIHQRMGLITTIPLIATVVTSLNAGGKNTSSASRDLHLALGAVTGDLYFITAYYAIRAPRVPGTKTRGPIHFHKTMAWIHGPGMIVTPILGAIAFEQKSKGERIHGIASAHGPVAIVTAGAFGAALLSVSTKF
ncbi:MAG: carboxypeptidase regulatory-like domain-containing protein [Acidobacteria bacterium]|nr:carboxypeptidase regulatory-like domain-containing protein [Acidobacteriota bacterium]